MRSIRRIRGNEDEGRRVEKHTKLKIIASGKNLKARGKDVLEKIDSRCMNN